MTVKTRPLTEVARQALEVLTRELGAADTARFIGQFTAGTGDYTRDRDAMFDGQSLDQLVSAIQARKEVTKG